MIGVDDAGNTYMIRAVVIGDRYAALHKVVWQVNGERAHNLVPGFPAARAGNAPALDALPHTLAHVGFDNMAVAFYVDSEFAKNLGAQT